MEFVLGLRCINCGKSYQPNEIDYFCIDCGYEKGILDIEYDYAKISQKLSLESLKKASFSMWRYLPLLPIADKEAIQHLQVGWTPLYQAKHLADYLEVACCWVKDEGRNPTSSFKDRASAVGVVKALEKKTKRIACASTGNAASSLAGFAAAAQLPATIFVPQKAPSGKIAQLMVFGAEVLAVNGTYDEAWELCMQACQEFGWYNRNCAINPYLVEGKKTVALEFTEQILRLEESMPDWVAVSVGDGCTVAGIAKGFKEMQALGFIQKVPRILGVQAEGCQPFVKAWQTDGVLHVESADTLADSIAVAHPRNFQKGLKAITQSHGAYLAISDKEILEAINILARKAAVFAEPAGAAAVMGVKKAVKEGLIQKNESVAIIVTGNGLKDVESAIKAAGKPKIINPTIESVRENLK